MANNNTSTTFILYLFDAIRAILFGQRPELRLYELQLPLPSYETTFSASDEAAWSAARQESAVLTRLDYSLILSALLSNNPPEHELNFSVMGNFIILHGKWPSHGPPHTTDQNPVQAFCFIFGSDNRYCRIGPRTRVLL
jgi:hypothetical protein